MRLRRSLSGCGESGRAWYFVIGVEESLGYTGQQQSMLRDWKSVLGLDFGRYNFFVD